MLGLTHTNLTSSQTHLTAGMGTSHLPAFSFLFCLTILDMTLACVCCSLSSRYAGTAPPSAGASADCLVFFSWWALMVFFICTFSLKRSLFVILALIPLSFLACSALFLGALASFFLFLSW